MYLLLGTVPGSAKCTNSLNCNCKHDSYCPALYIIMYAQDSTTSQQLHATLKAMPCIGGHQLTAWCIGDRSRSPFGPSRRRRPSLILHSAFSDLFPLPCRHSGYSYSCAFVALLPFPLPIFPPPSPTALPYFVLVHAITDTARQRLALTNTSIWTMGSFVSG